MARKPINNSDVNSFDFNKIYEQQRLKMLERKNNIINETAHKRDEFLKFGKNILTRIVIFEKNKNYNKEELNRLKDKTFEIIMDGKKRLISKYVNDMYVDVNNNRGPSFDMCFSEFEKEKPDNNDDVNVMWLQICELF